MGGFGKTTSVLMMTGQAGRFRMLMSCTHNSLTSLNVFYFTNGWWNGDPNAKQHTS